ncbi:unnamed protein product [Prorocentrum cordatum]|uniref:Uncharacterized protein n=1 Tax=Prorocentrum cordatum TaxID=2364126 RepID=A0ABN9T2C9_9DINO|nr:unnamed protein product [Polarella glacialis]
MPEGVLVDARERMEGRPGAPAKSWRAPNGRAQSILLAHRRGHREPKSHPGAGLRGKPDGDGTGPDRERRGHPCTGLRGKLDGEGTASEREPRGHPSTCLRGELGGERTGPDRETTGRPDTGLRGMFGGDPTASPRATQAATQALACEASSAARARAPIVSTGEGTGRDRPPFPALASARSAAGRVPWSGTGASPSYDQRVNADKLRQDQARDENKDIGSEAKNKEEEWEAGSLRQEEQQQEKGEDRDEGPRQDEKQECGKGGQRHAQYEANRPEMEKGLEGVKTALKILREYYAKDAAHDAAEGASAGVISLLEVVESDFSKLLAEMTATETTSQADYDRETRESQLLKTTKDQDVAYKTKEHKQLDKNLAEDTAERSSVQTELSAIMDYKAKIQEMCVAKAEPYAESKRRREEEISGLKEALQILEGESVLIQRRLRGFKRRQGIVTSKIALTL